MFNAYEVKFFILLSLSLTVVQNNLTEPKLQFYTWQGNSSELKMSKHENNKAPTIEEEPKV